MLVNEREREYAVANGLGDDDRPTSPTRTVSSGSSSREKPPLPAIFTDNGWHILNRSILSTSNCGNPALRLFGFGPVAADGFGIGYIIKDEGISVYVPVLLALAALSGDPDLYADATPTDAHRRNICRRADSSIPSKDTSQTCSAFSFSCTLLRTRAQSRS